MKLRWTPDWQHVWRRNALAVLSAVAVFVSLVVAFPVRPRPVLVLIANGLLALGIAALTIWLSKQDANMVFTRPRRLAVIALPVAAIVMLLVAIPAGAWMDPYARSWSVWWNNRHSSMFNNCPESLAVQLALYALIAIGLWLEPTTEHHWQTLDGFGQAVVRSHRHE